MAGEEATRIGSMQKEDARATGRRWLWQNAWQ